MLWCRPRDPAGVLPVCSAPPVGTWWHSTSIPASFCLSRCAVESRRLRAVLPAGPAPLVGVRVGSPASQGRGPLPAAVAVAAVTEGHGQDRAPRQERLRSRAGLPGTARAVAQRGRPAPRPGSARFEGEGARLGEPTLPAAPCAKVDFCSHLASPRERRPGGRFDLAFCEFSLEALLRLPALKTILRAPRPLSEVAFAEKSQSGSCWLQTSWA